MLTTIIIVVVVDCKSWHLPLVVVVVLASCCVVGHGLFSIRDSSGFRAFGLRVLVLWSSWFSGFGRSVGFCSRYGVRIKVFRGSVLEVL